MIPNDLSRTPIVQNMYEVLTLKNVSNIKSSKDIEEVYWNFVILHAAGIVIPEYNISISGVPSCNMSLLSNDFIRAHKTNVTECNSYTHAKIVKIRSILNHMYYQYYRSCCKLEHKSVSRRTYIRSLSQVVSMDKGTDKCLLLRVIDVRQAVVDPLIKDIRRANMNPSSLAASLILASEYLFKLKETV
jgi:hypothetical protein